MRMVYRIMTLVLSLTVFYTFICCDGEKLDPVTTSDVVEEEDVTYSSHIQELLDTYCLGCHSIDRQGADRSGAPVDVNFDTYDDIVMWADSALSRIQSGTMPPSGGIPEDERALFQQWYDDGMPEDM